MNYHGWIDKKAYLFVVCELILIIAVLYAIIKTYIDKDILGFFIMMFAAIAMHIMMLPYWPLKIRDGKVSVVADAFPVLRRIYVPLKNVKRLSITGPRRWDEKGGGRATLASTHRWLRIEADDGRRYRNVLLSPREFKTMIDLLIGKGLIKRESVKY